MILILRALGLGDLLTSVPALRAIRRYHRDETIMVAAPPDLAPILRRVVGIEHVVVLPRADGADPTVITGLSEPPRLAINMHGRDPAASDALRALGPEVLWAYGEPDAPPWQEREHEVARWCRLVTAYGCPANPADLHLSRRGPRSAETVVIHPGAGDEDRRWPAERFAEVARALAAKGLDVRVTAGPAELELATEVATLAGLPGGAVASDLDLAELADLVGASALVISGDTGVAHLATACRTPSVVLFGPRPPARSGPPPDSRHRALWFASERSRRPGEPHPALLRIRPLDVLTAAEDLLANRWLQPYATEELSRGERPDVAGPNPHGAAQRTPL